MSEKQGSVGHTSERFLSCFSCLENPFLANTCARSLAAYIRHDFFCFAHLVCCLQLFHGWLCEFCISVSLQMSGGHVV